jgi:hypothetical protein
MTIPTKEHARMMRPSKSPSPLDKYGPVGKKKTAA